MNVLIFYNYNFGIEDVKECFEKKEYRFKVVWSEQLNQRKCTELDDIFEKEFAPYGYLKATDIQFTVEDTGKVQHVEMKDEVPTGSIVINKDGEFVTDTTLMKGYWYDFIFNFFKDSLAGVTFDVYAKEDIVSADGLDTVYHKAGDKVATIVTNDKGIARIDDLPLGKYYLVETKTIDGFVLDDTPIEADLSYIDQNKKFVFAGMDVTNERQKVQITVTKTDSETKEALEGAVFGLFAKEDIVNKDGIVIVSKSYIVSCLIEDISVSCFCLNYCIMDIFLE